MIEIDIEDIDIRSINNQTNQKATTTPTAKIKISFNILEFVFCTSLSMIWRKRN